MSTRIADHVAIDPRAEIDDDVEIGPFCVIGPKVRIGRGHEAGEQRHPDGQRHHRLPQPPLSRRGHRRRAAGHQLPRRRHAGRDRRRQHHPRVRHHQPRHARRKTGVTRVGNGNFLMACCHVAHDCQLGDHIIIANATLLGGHVHIHDHASLLRGGGGAPFRHHRRLQLRGRRQRRAPRRAALHARRGLPGPAPLHQRRRPETQQLFRPRDPGPGRGPPAAVPRKVGLDNAWEILRSNGQLVPQVNHLLSFVQGQHEGQHGRGREHRRAA